MIRMTTTNLLLSFFILRASRVLDNRLLDNRLLDNGLIHLLLVFFYIIIRVIQSLGVLTLNVIMETGLKGVINV